MLRHIRKLMEARGSASKVELLPDYVWVSSRAKLGGIRRVLEARVASGPAAVALVAHFQDVHLELERVAAEYSGSLPVRALLARQLSGEAARTLRLDETVTLDLLVGERHPLASADAELVRFAEALPCRCRIAHHLSLDDPLLRAFGAEPIRALLDRLGGTEEEPLTSTLITRSIRKAQERVEARATGRHDAESAAEWLERNT